MKTENEKMESKYTDNCNGFEKFRIVMSTVGYKYIVYAESVIKKPNLLWACANEKKLIELCLELSDFYTFRVALATTEGLFGYSAKKIKGRN